MVVTLEINFHSPFLSSSSHPPIPPHTHTHTHSAYQGGVLVVLGVDGPGAGQDEEALLRADDLAHPQVGQGLALDGPVDIGIRLPAQQAPANDLLKGALQKQSS